MIQQLSNLDFKRADLALCLHYFELETLSFVYLKTISCYKCYLTDELGQLCKECPMFQYTLELEQDAFTLIM